MVVLTGQLSNPSQLLLRLLNVPNGSAARPPSAVRHHPRQRHRRLDEKQTRQLVADYEAGALMAELAMSYRISRQTVGAILLRENAAIRPKGLNAEQIADAVDLYSKGMSVARIAQHLGVAAKTVWTRLREHDVRMRDSHGRPR